MFYFFSWIKNYNKHRQPLLCLLHLTHKYTHSPFPERESGTSWGRSACLRILRPRLTAKGGKSRAHKKTWQEAGGGYTTASLPWVAVSFCRGLANFNPCSMLSKTATPSMSSSSSELDSAESRKKKNRVVGGASEGEE